MHKLPAGKPTNYHYSYTRCFYIYATGQGAPHLSQLQFGIIPMQEIKKEWGNPRQAGEWDHFAALLMRSYNPMSRGVRTPLDFCISDVSRVVLRLLGNFWRFSDEPAAVTTKSKLSGKYFDLRRHKLDANNQTSDADPDEDCRCVSFFTMDPDDYRLRRRDGLNLHVDFIGLDQSGQIDLSRLLPVLIDPDVENKGNNPTPIPLKPRARSK
jgi:hypothetical protein